MASLALTGWQKALPDQAVRRLIGRYLRAYLARVSNYASTTEDDDFAPHLENTDGPVLVEGYSQSLDNDVVLSMKQANVPAVSPFVDTSRVDGYFEHEGHRTVESQRALQVHTDPLLGYTELDGVGYVVAEVSSYEFDLDWVEINEPEEMASVVQNLGRATAKVHCASDEDSDQSLVTFQTEVAISEVVRGRRKELVADLTDFAIDYALRVRRDHEMFVDAFREGRIGGVSAT